MFTEKHTRQHIAMAARTVFLQFALLFATFISRFSTIVEDIDQQAFAIFHDADIAVESSVRHAVPTRLHHELAEREVHHVPRFGVQRLL